jgi:hypothetical protein
MSVVLFGVEDNGSIKLQTFDQERPCENSRFRIPTREAHPVAQQDHRCPHGQVEIGAR